MTKDAFAEKYGEQPRRDDLTYIAPKQDDPTEQVGILGNGFGACAIAADQVCGLNLLL